MACQILLFLHQVLENIIIFASDSGIGLTFFSIQTTCLKSRSNVRIYLVSKDIGKFTRPKSIKNLKGILYIYFSLINHEIYLFNPLNFR